VNSTLDRAFRVIFTRSGRRCRGRQCIRRRAITRRGTHRAGGGVARKAVRTDTADVRAAVLGV